jgi:hypothetical protein
VYSQRPIAQFTVEFVRLEHTIPHAPQWFASVFVSTQALPQLVCPAGHEGATSGIETTSGCDAASGRASGIEATSSPGTIIIESIVPLSAPASRSRVGTVVHATDNAPTAASIEASSRKRIAALYSIFAHATRIGCANRTTLAGSYRAFALQSIIPNTF